MRTLPSHGLLAVLLGLALAVPSRADKADVDKLNKKVDSFSLKTAQDKTFSLADLKEKKAIVEANSKKRKEIQAEIGKLNKEREKFIADEQAKQKEKSKTESLDTAVIKAVREQAAKKEFKFEK